MTLRESRDRITPPAPIASSFGGHRDSPPSNVPLLNQYKYALLRRRLFQTLTGGLKIRRAPWYIHLIQLTLWIAPFITALPFIIISALHLWNDYYLALIYGFLQGLTVLLLEIVGVIVRYRQRRHADNVVGDTDLDDEESIDFVLESCCTFETFDFFFARKKLHSLILHPFISGLLSFSACFILQPSIILESVHGDIVEVVAISIIGWYALCSAHYSLSVSPPHETATYRPTDPLELRFVTRPFYIVAIAAIFIPLRLLVSTPTVTLYLHLLHVSLCLLPLGWSIGILPPLDALVPWIMEQGLTRLMGGSPMATDLRLVIMFFMSSISVAIVASLATLNDTLSVLLATAFGFLLSQDLITSSKIPLYLLSLLSRAKILRSVYVQVTDKIFTSFYGWDCRTMSDLKFLAVHYVISIIKGATLLAASLVIVYFAFLSNGNAEELGTKIAAGIVIGLFCLLQGSNILQRIYLFGVLRNPLFPMQAKNVTKFNKRRKLLHYVSISARIIHAYVSPLVMLAFIGFSLKTPNTSTSIPPAWCGIVAARILRKVWQNTSSAHFEVTMVVILYFAIPASTNNVWTTLGSGSQLFIISIATEILQDFLQKLWFAGTMFGSFVFIRKHRKCLLLTVIIVIATFIFLPLLLAIILISSIFSAPLLPLFTLPVFFISFPRTKRFWPSLINYANSYSKCEDSIYYQQSESEISKALHHTVSSGAVSATPGTYLLLRFEDRLSVVTFLEHGYSHCALAIKCLELQETSCHSIEATKIDSIFEDAYNPGSKSCPKFWFNTHFSNTLQPVDSEVVEVYSDARNVLTGIIDQPSSLTRFPGNLIKCIVWVLYHHFTQAAANGQKNVKAHEPVIVSGVQTQIKNCDSGETNVGKNNINSSKNAWTLETNSASDKIPQYSKQESTKINRELDTFSWSESISSNDEEHNGGLNTASNIFSLDAIESLPGLIPQDRPLDINPQPKHNMATTNIDDIIGNNNDEVMASEVRLSAIPISGMSKLQQVGDLEAAPGMIEIPQRWTEGLPLSYSQLSELKAIFPTDWLEFLLKRDHDETSTHLTAYLKEKLVDLALVCFALADVGTCSRISGRRAEETKPFDIFEGFGGKFPYSTHSDWLSGDQHLNTLLLKAYRYAMKLLYDEVSLGEVDDFSELADYLESYSADYFIGLESEKGWEEAVIRQVPHLFSLGRDPEKNVYTAHVLSLQPHVVHIGQLNPAAIHCIWSDLSLELLYLTNDDEERYSIQAHPTLLRNLTIQTSDPPLGYYIYSSGVLRVPCA